MKPKSKSTLKTMIIGLDGATFDLILPFIQAGELPNMKYLMAHGAWGELTSTMPPVTAAAWPSFMTGENPGKHGILKFVDSGQEAQSGNDTKRMVSTKSYAGRTFFDALALEGKKCGAITIPVTYPPWDINGVMISGYPSPDNEKIYSMSGDLQINIDEPLNFSAEYYQTASEEQILKDCIYRDRLRADLAFDLLDQHAFDCFAIVLGGIDRACHDYWKYFDSNYPGVQKDKRERFKNAILENYQLGDEQIGRFLELYGETANLFVISDHGSGRHPFEAFNANVWLRHTNWLNLSARKALPRELARKIFHLFLPLITPGNRKSPPVLNKMRNKKNLNLTPGRRFNKAIDWKRTKAFYYPLVYPVDGIMINLEGRQANGVVHPGKEYHQVVYDIIDQLLEFKNPRTNEPVVEKAIHREDVYSGPYLDRFPDIIYVLNPRYVGALEILGSPIMKVPKFRLSQKSGLHLMNGVFISHGPDIEQGRVEGANIIDVAPTILYCSGQPIPENMDGKVLVNIFDKALLQKQPILKCTFRGSSMYKDFDFDSQEKEQMEKKLRSLGYID